MDARLQALLDHHEIRDVLSTYCQGSDRFDGERMASVFHTDSWVDHADNHGPGRKFVAEALPEQVKYTSAVWHQMGQSMIEVEGDAAKAETYVLVAIRRAPPRESQLDLMGGRFVDTLMRENGRWLIKTRVQLRDWSVTMPAGQDNLARSGFALGMPSAEDPFYRVFGMVHSGKTRIDAD